GRDSLGDVALEEPAVPAVAPAGSGSGWEAVPSGSAMLQTPSAPAGSNPLPAAGLSDAVVTVRPLPGGILAGHPFDEYRLERERMRSRQAEALEAMVRDPSVGEEVRREA